MEIFVLASYVMLHVYFTFFLQFSGAAFVLQSVCNELN